MGYGVTDDLMEEIKELREEVKVLGNVVEKQDIHIKELERETDYYRKKLGLPVTRELCPHCKGNSQFFGNNDAEDLFWIVCEGCGAQGPMEPSQSEALKAWEERQN